MKNVSGYELGETMNFLCEVQNRLRDYSHIKHVVSKSFIKALDSQIVKINNELNSRKK